MSVSFLPGRTDKLAFSDLIRELFMKVSELISTQLELTKTEIKVETRKLAIAAALGLAAAALGFVFLLFFGLSLILVLAQGLGFMWASLITSGIFLVLTLLFTSGMIMEIKKKSELIETD